MTSDLRKMTTDQQLDVLFGLHFATAAALRALISNGPNKDVFLSAFELELAKELAEVIKTSRSELTATAIADYAAILQKSAAQCPSSSAHTHHKRY